jgi:hypothetical protein
LSCDSNTRRAHVGNNNARDVADVRPRNCLSKLWSRGSTKPFANSRGAEANRRVAGSSKVVNRKSNCSWYVPKSQVSIDPKLTTISPVDKWADYEDEIQRLKKAHSQQNLDPPRASTPTQEIVAERTGSPSRFSYLPVQNRLSSLLSRKSTPNLQAPPTPGAPSTTELVAALTSEQTLRKDAERKLSEASGELEELTAHLFMQANEMVATERKARAKLEERVELLERRDGEKRKRLERLEGAVQRIERVRGLLAPGR